MEFSYENAITFQGDYLTDLNSNTDYPKINTAHMLKLFLEWIDNKQKDIMTFRDKQHVSGWTGINGAKPIVPWKEQFAFDNESFIKNTKDE